LRVVHGGMDQSRSRWGLAPSGAKACSLEREPLERRPPNSREPRRGDGNLHQSRAAVALRGSRIDLGLRSQGLTPLTTCLCPSGAGLQGKSPHTDQGNSDVMSPQCNRMIFTVRVSITPYRSEQFRLEQHIRGDRGEEYLHQESQSLHTDQGSSDLTTGPTGRETLAQG